MAYSNLFVQTVIRLWNELPIRHFTDFNIIQKVFSFMLGVIQNHVFPFIFTDLHFKFA